MDILEHIGRTPLVPLRSIARGAGVPVLVKCEHLNPGGSVKDRIAKAIVDDAEQRGVLRSGMTLIEATAGNTGVGLALVAALRGYKLICVMPEKMCADKRVALEHVAREDLVERRHTGGLATGDQGEMVDVDARGIFAAQLRARVCDELDVRIPTLRGDFFLLADDALRDVT